MVSSINSRTRWEVLVFSGASTPRRRQVARIHLEHTALFGFPQERGQLLDRQRFHLLVFQFWQGTSFCGPVAISLCSFASFIAEAAVSCRDSTAPKEQAFPDGLACPLVVFGCVAACPAALCDFRKTAEFYRGKRQCHYFMCRTTHF